MKALSFWIKLASLALVVTIMFLTYKKIKNNEFSKLKSPESSADQQSNEKAQEESAVFHPCPSEDKRNLSPISAMAYKISKFQALIDQDRTKNSTPISEKYDGNPLSFMKDAFNTAKGKVLDQPAFATFCMSQFNVTERHFDDGLDVSDDTGKTQRINEWFGLDAFAELYVPKEGTWEFELESDDGALFYVDQQLAVDNDGRHDSFKRLGKISLSRGVHKVRMKYFQGPQGRISLVLKWRLNAAEPFEVVPRYADTKGEQARGLMYQLKPYKQDY